MSAIPEGARVSYCGDGGDGLVIDDKGKVLSAAGSGSHVMWSTGKRKGEITLTANVDLVATRTVAYEDDLDSGGLVSVAVRDTYDSGGEVALLNALNEEGHLATFAPIAEEALQMVASRIRQDPSIREVLAQLDDDEGSGFVALAASVLLRDAFGGE